VPALWLVFVGTRGLLQASPSRKWGVFATGLVFGPLLILVLEFIALFAIGVLAILWFVLNPNLSNQLNSLALSLQTSGPNPDVLLPTLLPLLLNPFILFLVFAFVSVVVPMIEEALKPIGVWFLAGQKITPAQGFALGVLSGVGFGLFENLGNSSAGGEVWALLVSTRISTLLLHSLSAGLVGWALASAWSQKRYLRLGVTYLFAVLLHGLWNGMAVLSFFSSLQGQTNTSVPAGLVQLGNLSTVGIVALGAFNLVFFIGFNATLRRSLRDNPPPPQPLTSPPPLPSDETPPPPSSDVSNPSEEENPTHLEPGA
jgi:RsiW-degrading membrane proteinase PrsW (M82 family)